MLLFLYNEYSFQKSLKVRYREMIKDAVEGRELQPKIFKKGLPDPSEVTDKLVTDTFSFEMMM